VRASRARCCVTVVVTAGKTIGRVARRWRRKVCLFVPAKNDHRLFDEATSRCERGAGDAVADTRAVSCSASCRARSKVCFASGERRFPNPADEFQSTRRPADAHATKLDGCPRKSVAEQKAVLIRGIAIEQHRRTKGARKEKKNPQNSIQEGSGLLRLAKVCGRPAPRPRPAGRNGSDVRLLEHVPFLRRRSRLASGGRPTAQAVACLSRTACL